MQDITVFSWDELNQAVFRDTWDESLRRYRSPYVYRGMSDAAMDLSTTLCRLGGRVDQIEQHLLRAFRKYATRDAVSYNSIWNWLALAQHHGLPTRLLDWTFSPLISAHFATEDVSEYDRDGVIWAIDVSSTNQRLPRPLASVLEREAAQLFSAEMIDEVTKNLRDLQRISDQEFVIFFEPPSLNPRFINQYALFSLTSSPTTLLNHWLEDKPDAFYRIIIPSSLKWEIRDKLDLLNINERLLFPDLDGLSRWLRRYYFPRPDNDTHGDQA